MNLSIFSCPVCSFPLTMQERSYICENKHSYDISKEGYVNLLLANQKKSSDPGDSKEMLDARKSFLNRGYYKSLARAVTSLIIKHRRHTHLIPYTGKLSYCQRRNITAIESDVIPQYTLLDAGCGEGYYTDYISKNNYLKNSEVYGIDISREGIKSASKRNSNIHFAVAGIYHLPVIDNSIDAILNIFAPFNETEFIRVLKNNGAIFSVTPGAHHLFELKKNLYDEVYLNDEEFELSDKFKIKEIVRLRYELNIHNREDISNLLKMTPYYHKSSPERIDSFLQSTGHLTTTADFVIRVIAQAELKD